MLQAYLRTGITEELPAYLSNRLTIANYVSLFILFIGVSYSGLTYFVYPEITFIPILGILLVLIGFFLNKQGLHGVYRMVLALVPVLLVVSYHSYIVPEGGEAIPATMMLVLAFSLLPFLLFDLREKGYILSLLVFNLITILSVPENVSWLEADLDDSLFRSGFLYHFTVATGSILAFASLMVMAWVNFLGEQKSEQLIQQAEENAALMAKKEKDLEDNLNQLKAAQKEDDLRKWAAEGFSMFAQILRSQEDNDKQYDRLISGIVNYLKANQGGLYLLEEKGNEHVLELKACFAYGRKKFQEKEIAPGQGLVGQCYLEKDHIHLTELPDRYTYITSGLGDATPKALLLIPLIANDKVEGILELAAFQKFENYQIDFLMKLGEDIASAVSVIRVNSLTRRLLSESQQQTEEMRAQEEEMRQNMEELSATQEEMQRKETEYMNEIARLKEELNKVKVEG